MGNFAVVPSLLYSEDWLDRCMPGGLPGRGSGHNPRTNAGGCDNVYTHVGWFDLAHALSTGVSVVEDHL